MDRLPPQIKELHFKLVFKPVAKGEIREKVDAKIAAYTCPFDLTQTETSKVVVFEQGNVCSVAVRWLIEKIMGGIERTYRMFVMIIPGLKIVFDGVVGVGILYTAQNMERILYRIENHLSKAASGPTPSMPPVNTGWSWGSIIKYVATGLSIAAYIKALFG